ncbi:TPA: porin, partial [Salmonella enterica subsp. enterica serovar Napoli]
DQFLQEREGNTLVAVRDNGGVWSVCRGVTRIDGKPVVKGQRLTQSQCDHYNAIERDKALAWVNKNVHIPLTEPQKAGIASFCPYIGKNSRIGKDLGLAKDSGAFTNKTDNWEVVAQYQFDFGLRPSIAYLQSKARNTGYGDIDLVKYTDIGATYYFNKNMSAYVDYKINLLKNDNPAGLATDNIVATGLVYQF